MNYLVDLNEDAVKFGKTIRVDAAIGHTDRNRNRTDTMTLPKLAITLGDVAGIGPEIVVKAWPRLC